LTGTVFDDTNRNGIQDNGELGREGVVVNLLTKDGAQVATIQTDSAGLMTLLIVMLRLIQVRLISSRFQRTA